MAPLKNTTNSTFALRMVAKTVVRKETMLRHCPPHVQSVNEQNFSFLNRETLV